MAVKKRDRFEVFKRDKFTCQYCGRCAPGVILELDHIEPKSKGGKDTLLNYTTSCRDCNQGKGDRELSDDSLVAKQRRQLEDLQERQNQIQMMIEWQQHLMGMDGAAVTAAAEMWEELAPGYELNENGLKELKRWIRKYGLSEVLESMRVSGDTYVEHDEKGIATGQSWGKGWEYIGRICYCRQQEKDKPHMRDLYYIRGILRRRFSYLDQSLTLNAMEIAYDQGVATIGELKQLALSAHNWGNWQDRIGELIDRGR